MADNNPLGYAPDVGVENFSVNLDYQVDNRINVAGPSPNAIYGPGSWATVLSYTLYSDAAFLNKVLNPPLYSVEIGFGAQGVNQNLPGLKRGGLNTLPLQVKITNLQIKPANSAPDYLQFQSFTVDFVLQSPTACKFSPASVVTTLAAEPYGATENIDTEPALGPLSPPTSQIYPFPYFEKQLQPFILAVPVSEVAALKAKTSAGVTTPFFTNTYNSGSTLVWRLYVPGQAIDQSATSFTTITIGPDWLNRQNPPTTSPPFIINVNANGLYPSVAVTL